MRENPVIGPFPQWPLRKHLARIGHIRGLFFNLDYSYVTRFKPIIFWVGLPAELLFYFFETSQGYWDSLPLRFSVIVGFSTLMIVDWKKRTGWNAAWRWESAVFLGFPIQTTISFLENHGIPYYSQSLCMMFFILGMVTKPWMVPVHLIFGVGATSLVYFWLTGWDPDLYRLVLSGMTNAGFSGLVSVCIILSLERSHRKIADAQVALAKAVDEKKKAEDDKEKAAEIAKAYEELKAREELIRIFVRPSIVEEIHRGKNPSLFEPVMSNLAIMFCDIRDFTHLTEILTPYEKQTFLNQYFTMMTAPILRNGGEVDKIMGDCVMGVFPGGASAIQAAIDMRLELQKFNQEMFRRGLHMIKNGIGIAKGDVMQGNFGSMEKLDRTVIGEAVNIAARLESKTKMYNLEVVVGEDVIRDLVPDARHFRWIDLVQVKGSSRRLKIYEVYGHQPPEVRRFKDETRDMLEKGLTIYFNKGFKDALRIFKAMLERVPPHRLIPHDRMDNILPYYIAHCEAWINDQNGSWERIEKWDGVHVFYEK